MDVVMERVVRKYNNICLQSRRATVSPQQFHPSSFTPRMRSFITTGLPVRFGLFEMIVHSFAGVKLWFCGSADRPFSENMVHH
jgi:hypothetical protein